MESIKEVGAETCTFLMFIYKRESYNVHLIERIMSERDLI